MTWASVPICLRCWRLEMGSRKPVRVIPSRAEVCYRCDQLTTLGIYVRRKVERPND